MVSSPHRRSRKLFKERMEKSSLLYPNRNRCFLILFAIVFWWLICFFNFTAIFPSTDVVARSTAPSVVQIPLFGSQKGESLRSSFLPTPRKYSEPSPIQQTKKPIEFTPLNKHIWQPMEMFGEKGDPCAGRYVYMHELPSEFNLGMLDNCRNLSLWTNMCKFIANAGLGPPLEDSEGAFSEHGWFATNQFATEVIFHNRMKQYGCLTNDSSKAAAIFVPFYAGLDISRYLWGASIAVRDSASLGLTRWLQDRPEWKSLNGRDHFMIAGRITWDFRRKTDDEKDWGNKLLILPALKNMSTLVIESSPWHRNDFGIPYPTYFHPSQDSDIVEWQNRMRAIQRSALFSFAGAPRPEIGTSIRGQIMEQCRQSDRCRLLECDFGESKCHIPSVVMKLFEESVFCLQPQGDSFTRRSIFDSMLAGCIPVFFHVHSAYTQYVWHLPQNRSKYSVFIPEDDIRRRNVSIEKLLLGIPSEKIHSMREEVIKLIPGLLYADPRSRLETMKDAFDISVQAVIDRVTDVRFRILEGRDMDETIDYGEGNDDEEGDAPGKEEESRRWEGQRRKGEQEGAEHGKQGKVETLEEIWQRDKEEKEIKRSLKRTDSS